MYKHTVKSAADHLATEQDLPQNATAFGNHGSLEFAGAMGALEVVVTAASDISLAQDATLTIGLEHSADDGVQEAFANVGEQFAAVSASGPLAFEEGEVVCRLAVPSTLKKHARLTLATTDAAATGAVDAWLEYLAR
ncbi:hypothetical protein [Desulfohalovibrio reitneri]|uniref:hypothetical protein n=1 Tax=Desulfohalovibrio reitneri TaxID=1307759 RepID=UPI0004A736E7|nr:hypothetical protein [Desulfohalovibrio reitneri]